MKRYGNIYEKVYEIENIKKAIMYASRGKRKRRDVRNTLKNIDKKAAELSEQIKNHTYQLTPYTHDTVIGGTNNKARDISKPAFFPDQVIHWAIYLQTKEIFQNAFYEYSCGSVPGRGPHYGKRAVEKWVKYDKKNTKYYLKMDIHHFYPSVEPERMKVVLRKKFKDPELLQLFDDILSMHTGLPIGILLSQWLGNLFLTPLDRTIKGEWAKKYNIKYYIRYMDDMVVFGNNKKNLHKLRRQVEKWLNENGLELKDNWQVCRFEKEPLDYMGFRFYRGYTTLRKSILYRITRKAKEIGKHGANYHRAAGMISYLGYVKCTDSYNLYHEKIKPYINVKKLKRVVRKGKTYGNSQKRKHSKTD